MSMWRNWTMVVVVWWSAADIAIAQNPVDFARKVATSARTGQKAQEVVTNLGLNCADYANVELFVKEVYQILSGLGEIMAESTSSLALKKDFPTACHVLTKAQLAAYTEGTERSTSSKCLTHNPFGGCALSQNTTADSPRPSYYWPKYFLEVNEKGNDSHAAFAYHNGFYGLNRRLARSMAPMIDMNGAISLTALVLGGTNALGGVGMSPGPVDASQLMSAAALTPFENMRIRGNADKTLASYEVNVWPVAMSETLAAHFTVCGPGLVDEGKSPGGYHWPVKGAPMTCPVAMSRDAASFWDTGMLDYLDPQAVAQMGAASNPVSCGGAAAMDALGGLGGAQRDSLGDKGAVNASTSSLSGQLRQSILGCSFPILGSAEALASKATSMADSAKWSGPYCTVWGNLAPRMSSGLYQNDYSYANAALKFKLLSHELFGLPRGNAERWSLAYPWEGPGSSVDSEGRGEALGAMQNGIGEALAAFGGSGDVGGGASRSEALLKAGDPRLMDGSATAKYFSDRANEHASEAAYLASLAADGMVSRDQAVKEYQKRHGVHGKGEDAVAAAAMAAPLLAAETARAAAGELRGESTLVPGDRRIYTVWEKVQCTSPSKRLTISTGPVTTKKYESCSAAIKFEVYKYIQLEVLRQLCDFMGQNVGKPWR